MLDVLRAVAAGLVLIRHCGPLPEGAPGTLHLVFDRIIMAGWMGVDLFFVLSGFLVSGLLFGEYRKRGEIRFGRFLARRGMRIYPGFYLLFIVTMLFGERIGLVIKPRTIAAEGLFYQNYVWAMWTHTWSLAVEEHFYILLPLVLWILVRKARGHECRERDPFRLVIVIYTAVAIATLGARVWTNQSLPFSLITHYTPTHLRIDSLAAGALLGYLYHFHHDRLVAFARKRRWLLAVIALGGLVLPFVWPHKSPFMLTIGFTLLSWGCVALLLVLLSAAPRSRPASPALRLLAVIGRCSFAIYLWHIPVRLWGGAAIRTLTGREASYWDLAMLTVGGSVAVGIALTYLVELPLLRVRDRLWPARAGALT